jgi:hypothetical protein
LCFLDHSNCQLSMLCTIEARKMNWPSLLVSSSLICKVQTFDGIRASDGFKRLLSVKQRYCYITTVKWEFKFTCIEFI